MKLTKSGFTLIELLIAASIFSVITLSLYSAFRAGILSYHKIDSSIAISEGANIILARIESDLKNSFAYRGEDSMFKGEVKGLEFFTLSGTIPCRVKYALEDNHLKRSSLSGGEISFPAQDISFQYNAEDTWPGAAKPEEGRKALPGLVKIRLNISGVEFNKSLTLPLGEKLLAQSSG